MDEATAAAVLQLQLQDIDELLQPHNAGGDRSDAELALRLYQTDLNNRDALLSDRRIAYSISTAVRTDSSILADLSRDEVQCSTDRQLALRLGGQRSSRTLLSLSLPPETSQPLSEAQRALNRASLLPPDFVFPVTRGAHPEGYPFNESEEVPTSRDNTGKESKSRINQPSQLKLVAAKTMGSLADLVSIIRYSMAGNAKLAPPSSTENQATAAVASKASHTTTTQTCAACGDDVLHNEMMNLSCGHSYCGDCVVGLVMTALDSDSGFPPSCCLPIKLETLSGHISPDLIRRYKQKQYKIADACILLCATNGCKTLLFPQDIEGAKGHCKTCCRNTCRNCKSQWNDGHSCNEGKERERLEKLAKENGWQTCYTCRTVVSISFGCNHMRCLCKAEFCYVCGVKWKNCKCPRWNEALLLDRAEQALVHRERLGLGNDRRPRNQQLTELQRLLRRDCDHAHWVRLTELGYTGSRPEIPGVCEFCRYEGWRYIMRCHHCGLTACKHCSSDYMDDGEARWHFDFYIPGIPSTEPSLIGDEPSPDNRI